MNNPKVSAMATDWLNTSMAASQSAANGLTLGGMFVKHDKLIKQAVLGKMNDYDYNRLVSWIIKQLPATNNAFSDANVFETAWLVYTISKLQDYDNDQNWLNRENNFLVDIRTRFLAKRFGA